MPQEGLRCSWTALCVPKRGNVADEFEDAFAANLRRGRFAVADGASESSSAGLWAQLLVQRFVQTPGPWGGLPGARDNWKAATAGDDLPWYAETKRAEGAFSTLLGLTLFPGGGWEALAVGDSCLFQVRAGQLLKAFPIARAAQLDRRPALLSSHPPESSAGPVPRSRARGRWLPGDRLLLMTDALAGWFLQQVEAGRQPWDELEGLDNEEAFGHWVEGRRDSRELTNDDVTLLRVGGAARRDPA